MTPPTHHNEGRMTMQFTKDTTGQDNVLDGTVYVYQAIPGEGVYATIAGRHGVQIVAFDLTDLDVLTSAAKTARMPNPTDDDLTRITQRGLGPITELLADHVEGDSTSVETGDFHFYAEPAEVGRFTIGLGEIDGRGDRIAVCSRGNGIVELTYEECQELVDHLTEMLEDHP